MYVAVKGGETAIANSLDLLADKRRGSRDLAELTLDQIDQQLGHRLDQCPGTALGEPHAAAALERMDQGVD